MNKTTFIKKEIDQASFLYDRREIVTAPLWPHGSSSLFTIYTSSNQPHHQKIYYRTVYSDIRRTGSMDVDFSIAYGHFMGSGSSSGSFGLIASSSASGQRFPVSESMAIYSQYRSLLYDYDKRKYISEGKFRFYGLKDTNFGIYDWGFTSSSYWDGVNLNTFAAWRPTSNVTPIDSGEKITIPGVTSFALKEIIATSHRRKSNLINAYQTHYHFINIEGRLFQTRKFQTGNTPISTLTLDVKEAGIGKSWKDVATGTDHMITIASDGTLWGWGDNRYGQLGLGYTSTVSNPDNYFGNIDTQIPLQIGNENNWEKVYAGPYCSFAINSLGELYAWGSEVGPGPNAVGILGLGTNLVDYYNPTKVGSNTWRLISISMTDNANINKITVFGIDTSNNLWGWGYNGGYNKLSTANFTENSPVLLNSEGDWNDISSGADHVVAIEGVNRQLVGWGYAGASGELLASLQNETNELQSYTLNNRKNLIDLNNPGGFVEFLYGWIDVKCGDNFTIATSFDRRLWNWGDNSYGQLFADTSVGGLYPFENYASYLLLASNITGWDKLATGPFTSAASVNYPEENVFSMPTDDIYVINVNRWNFRDKMDSGTLQLSLRSVFTGSTGTGLLYQSSPGVEPVYRTITLVDESINYFGSTDEDPMYDVNSKGGSVFGLYSGSLLTGIHESAANSPYGIFFPENGIIILNGELLRNDIGRRSITLQTRRTPATSSGAFPTSSNADILYTSISGAMQLGLPFTANTVETKIPTYCFVRINNDEFNHTLNPSFYQQKNTFLIKEKLRKSPYPFTYITTIGLYNDQNDLLAVAKLSKPIKKTPSTELVVKIKLDI